MKPSYQSPESVEIGKADAITLGEKPDIFFDATTQSFERTIPTALDVDE
jgi:hypothetical protein